MNNIHEVLRRARDKAGVSSTRAMAKVMGVSHQAWARIESGDSLPSDETMMRLAAVSGIAADEALLLLNVWRSSGAASTTYRRLLNRLTTSRPSEAQA